MKFPTLHDSSPPNSKEADMNIGYENGMDGGHDDDNDELLDNNNGLSFVYVSLHDDKESNEENDVEVGGRNKRKKSRRKKSLEKKIACEYCEKKFLTEMTAYHHTCRMHKRILSCKICGKKQRSNFILGQHMLMHSDERKYQCSICGARLKYEASLNKHMKIIHSDERPYKCSVCGKSFKQNWSRKIHEEKKSCMWSRRGSSRYEKPFPQKHCEVCGKVFKVNSMLLKHLVAHSNEKPFKCEVCGKAFKSKAQANRHSKNVHTEVRAYQCSLCPLKFKAKNSLNAHQIVHVDKWDFKCDICDKAFKWLRSLRKHRVLHDRKEVDSSVQTDKDMMVEVESR